MKWLLALLALGLIAAAPARAPCSQPSDYHCAIGHQSELKLRGGISEAQRIIRIPPSALPLERPLTIRFAGLASAAGRGAYVAIDGHAYGALSMDVLLHRCRKRACAR